MALNLATTHMDADPDGMGGILALSLLEGPLHLTLPAGMEPTARRLWEDQGSALPPLLSPAEVQRRLEAEGPGRLLVADACRPDRLGWLAAELHRFVDVRAYDTHPEGPEDLPREPLPAAGAATSPLVMRLVERGIAPSPAEAGVMLVGIHVDTGHFTFPATSAVDHAAAAACLGWGADPRWPGHYAPRGFTAHQLHLLEKMADNVRLVEAAGMVIALVSLETEDYEPDASSLLGQLREAEGWPAVLLLASWGGKVQLIGRSDGQLDIGGLCADLGGGGHRQAAAATLEGLGLAEARALVLSASRRRLETARRVRELAIPDYVRADADSPIQQVADLLHQHRINALPLVRGQGAGLRVVGQVNRQDVEAALRHGLGAQPADTISARSPGCIDPDAPLIEAQRRFSETGGRLLMVGRAGEAPVALVTRTGLLQELAATVDPPRRTRPPHPRVVKGLLRKHLGASWPRVEQAGEVGAELGLAVQLVGGAVRDVLLERNVEDADLVVEGDAGALATALAARFGGEVVHHAAFGTAKWKTPDAGVTVDLARARAEFYGGRAQLPSVMHAALQRDLGRRDFSINAMAISLAPAELGAVIDPHGGYADLKQGLLRVLHGLSFQDDPTRCFRAARFAARFGFRLAEDTQGLLRGLLRSDGLADLGRERLGAELDRLLAEGAVVEGLRLLEEWRLSRTIHPKLALGPAELDRVRRVVAATHEVAGMVGEAAAPAQSEALWIALAFDLPGADRKPMLRFVPGPLSRQACWTEGPEQVGRCRFGLRTARSRSEAARRLRDIPLAAQVVALALNEEPTIDATLRWWLRQGRVLRTVVDGRRLQGEGLAVGPAIGKALAAAQDAAWDGLGEKEQLERALQSAQP